jgi:hypothetical protein
MGVIMAPLPKPKERKGLLAGEIAAARGRVIYEGVRAVVDQWRPVLVAMEAPGGSQSVKAAQALARAQQACQDATHGIGRPLFVTPQRNQRHATGKASCTKAEMRAAMEVIFGADAPLDQFLREHPPYLSPGQRLPPPSKWENAFDALGVAAAVWEDPTVAAIRATLQP